VKLPSSHSNNNLSVQRLISDEQELEKAILLHIKNAGVNEKHIRWNSSGQLELASIPGKRALQLLRHEMQSLGLTLKMTEKNRIAIG
jgi:hypothetical protein